MQSLHPAYLDNENVFRCPSTNDQPQIAMRYVNGSRHSGFGLAEVSPQGNRTGMVLVMGIPLDPSEAAGAETMTPYKCSYLYDSLSHFRDIAPNQAMGSDADGFTWRTTIGERPPYPPPQYWDGSAVQTNPMATVLPWRRFPQKPNHNDGQNVMYFDGHVRWSQGAYVSRDRMDNIFAPNGGPGIPFGYFASPDMWGPDTDAWLWDGENIGWWEWDG